MAEQTQMDSLLGDDPAFAPVEPEPAPVPIAEPAPAFEAGAPPPITAAEAGYVEPELAPPVEEAVGGAARIAIRDLEDGQRVRGVYAVRARELRRKRNGEPWLRMTVGDATGTTEAVCWDDAEVRYALCDTGTPVHVSGIFETSERWGSKIKITELRAAEEGEYELDDLAVPSEVSAERLEADLRDLLETVQNAELRELLDLFFAPGSEKWARFRDAPAAKTYHQAYRHGLLEHTLSVAQAVSAAANFFPGVDREIAVTGALLHDVGKLIAYNDDPLAIDLTDAGRLQGEIPLGYYTVRRAIEDIPGFDPHLAQCVLHIILSHHGSLEHGSPVVPATREAVLVHMIDNLGGRLGSFDRLERQLPEGESWSGFDRALSGSAWFSQRAA
ncbi:MAG TPA: HD domain-containing protein [Solirubrobacterales bacterium]|nr:HD domain-containing protein [Solirubrobacterales bacterium]